jgi:ammonia channel protein AmtB
MGALSRRAAMVAAPISVAAITAFATPAVAGTSDISAADTAWMIVATALVLMMTIPGLALFYSGMVRKNWACIRLKRRFNYDDSLDVFGVHGIGGMTGILLAGVFATASIGGTSGLIEGNPRLLLIQLYGVAVTFAWSGGVTYLLLKLVSAFVPLRVSKAQEMEGLDISQHGEALQ